MKTTLPPAQAMRHQPSEAHASLAPATDVILEHPGGEDEEERKTGATPIQRVGQAQPPTPHSPQQPPSTSRLSPGIQGQSQQ